ncbi:MAG TPA: glutamate mutase L [Candidatus Blautia stercorigallinarum]|uniref:Glutamate mutase L n=1 Tax=Candidatus Blautia stercorigallinarum TaxID=2838501 RepID=A0A9D1TFZ6_9FIRM|nr:glutamate mutase L [Candidatus Blautia stercorigallinarum]
MKPILLVDFGSTNTKVTAVDVEDCRILGTAAVYTTVETDINEGLDHGLEILEKETGPLDFEERYACSSAAGGLKMISIGLVPDLTAQASREASLGAGAKVWKTYSFQLTKGDFKEIEEYHPDIILLTGGTDGGNTENILYNAQVLSALSYDCPIVIAGNRNAADQCQEILKGRSTFVCENVMPRLGELNVIPAQKQIREIFLKRIVQGKGLSKAADLVSGIIMPTPSAMMEAMELLAEGWEDHPGLGELVGVDLGGATTDVYSVAEGNPANVGTVMKGLQEPYAKRSVEGDIGMRYSVHGILEAVGDRKLSLLSGIPRKRIPELVDFLGSHTDYIPDNEEMRHMDFALACGAVQTAVSRHAGILEQVYTPAGLTFLQSGKDLRKVKYVVATGGALIHGEKVREIAAKALYDPQMPNSLRPERAKILVDEKYILAAMGLLSQYYPVAALEIMKKEIADYGHNE